MESTGTNPLAGKKILFIEDDDFLRSLAVAKLEKAGFVLFAAADGKEGLEKVMTVIPDLVLLDLMLPAVDGFTVLEEMRKAEKTKTVPVVVFSNKGDEADIERCTKLGISNYLIKANFTLDEMVKEVSEILGAQK